MVTIFNTRELAIIFWGLFIVILAIYIVIKGRHFNSLSHVINSFFKLFRYPVIHISFIYLVVSFFIFYSTGIIKETDLIKDYLKLVLFVIIPLIPNVIQNYIEISLIDLMRSFVKVSTIFLFVINEYTFNFLIELFIVFACSVLVFVLGGIDKQKGYEKLKRLLSNILGMIFIFVIAGALYKFYLNIEDINEIIFWKKMFIEILIVSHFPLLFFLKYSMYYEQIFIRIKIKTELADTSYGKIKTLYILIKHLRFNEEKLRRFLKAVFTKEMHSYDDLQIILKN